MSAGPWPIAAAMINFAGETRSGLAMVDAAPEVWCDALDAVVAAGFSHVDPTDSWLPLAELSPGKLDLFLSLLEERGLSVPAISTARRSILDPDHGKQNLSYSHKVIDVAADIGASAVSFGLMRALTPEQLKVLWFWTVEGARDRDTSDEFRRAALLFRELGEHAQQRGVVLALEMYEDTLLGSADSAVRLLDEIDHPAVGLNPDLGNIVRLHRPIETISELIDRTVPRATYWHVKNYFRLEDPKSGAILTAPAAMAHGVINYRYAISLAIETGFQGAFCVEHYGGDGLSVSAVNREYILSVLPGPAVAGSKGTAPQEGTK